MSKEDSKIKVFTFLIIVLIILIAITTFALDITYQVQTLTSASISIDQFDADVSFIGINVGFIVLAILHIVSLFPLVFEPCFPQQEYLIFYTTLTCLALLIPREAILFKFISCFNFSNNGVIIARASLTLLSMLLLLLLSIKLVISDTKESSKCILTFFRIVAFVVSLCCVITIIMLNIFTLINLKSELKTEISPYKIDVGYFTKDEITKVEEGVFVKNSDFEKRFVGKLSDVIYSSNKKIAYSDCYTSCQNRVCSTKCTDYYWRTLNFNIICNAESKTFYTDCNSASSLIMTVKYLDGGAFPTYNCAMYKNSTCELSCPNLVLNYQLYLTQRSSNNVELAWKGLCNCGKGQPKVELTEDKSIDACKSSGSISTPKSELIFLASIFFYFIYLSIFKI